MSFKKKITPEQWKTGQALDNDLRALGFNLSATEKSIDPNIEDALVAASIEAVNLGSGRIAGLLVDWITIHFARINVDRLTLLIFSLSEREFKYVRLFWCANAQRLKDRRFQRIASLYDRKKRFDYIDRHLKEGDFKSTVFLIRRNGEDERFKNTSFRVPNKVFSYRPHQIFPTETIAKTHLPFRYRIMMGPSYRADMWAYLKRHRVVSAYRLAQACYGSYASAHELQKSFGLIRGTR